MAIAGTNIGIDSAEGMDKITSTEKVTSAYFSDGSTTLTGTTMQTESLSDTNEKYYFGISNTASLTTPEFHVAFGSLDGYGGNTYGSTVESPTEAVYKQWASLLLPPTEVTGGFFISSPSTYSTIASGKDSAIYVIAAERSLMKDRLNKKNWTIQFGGYNSAGASVSNLHLTDDSANDSPTATPVGDRYNVVSGSDGTIVSASTARNFGFFYPDMGVIVLSQQELSASIPGAHASASTVVRLNDQTAGPGRGFDGFHAATGVDNNYKTALRVVNCLHSGSMKFRDEEDQVSAQYFCRIRAGQCNFSNNPTFVSGSLNEMRHTSMKGNPTTYITQVQLYNDAGEMVAVGNLSTPLKKNFSSEATIKVKLTY
tara:strand:+ start:634 stop:1743 length:1110 start_codon:yes stop_codon:yes gene_type:complete